MNLPPILPLHLQGILWSNITSYKRLIKYNIIVAQFFQLWNKYKDTFKLSSKTPPLASFLGDPRFPDSYSNRPSFSLWINKNLTTLRSLQLKWEFPPFSSLQSSHGLPASELHNYHLIKSFYENFLHSQHLISTPHLNMSASLYPVIEVSFQDSTITSIILMHQTNQHRCLNGSWTWRLHSVLRSGPPCLKIFVNVIKPFLSEKPHLNYSLDGI